MTGRSRDEEVCELYKGGKSAEEVGRSVGLSAASVYIIVKKYGVQKGRAKSTQTAEAITPGHSKIGMRLYDKRTCTMILSGTDFGKQVGWSAKKVSLVEQGKYDLTLCDLQALASVFNTSIEELLHGL